MEAEDSHVHGWISDELNLGLWMITPSNEFRNGGPNKRELTSHVGPTTLAVFLADHYLGGANVEISDGEPWKKVLGPVFVYLNRAIGMPDPRGMLWDNAKTQMRTELQSWPYSFPMSEDFPHSDRRGSVSGRLLVHDRFVHKESKPANSAYVGLARPGVAGSWQTEGKGYQFWTRTNADGVFSINNVREGKYSLYAWVPGFIGDFKYEVDLDIAPGHHINLGGIVYEPPRDGRTLWEIGIPDRSAAEFYIPNPSPKYINKAFLVPERRKSSHPVDKFKQYGLWERYAELYPDHDLVYTVGASDYTKDWFYAQVTRKNKDNTFRPTTWQIVFHLQSVVSYGTYKLRLALASATLADLQVRVNSSPSDPPLLQTRMIGRDNAIARHGIHGVYWLFHVDVPSFCLVAGKNTIYLYQSISTGPFEGVMYDYLRLEAPSEMDAFMKSG
ncbi:hypothetical protein Scep_018480 [Stephania cephalantha]|uniref:Rhamnogalacturonan endolyase n=1 Tax=Stephania cephalantha TaxID=152367 RepID=A0AAP0I909_9MAGN